MFKTIFKYIWREKRGNFAIFTAVAFPFLMASVALTVDVTNLIRLKTDLQDANDSAALFATRAFQENNVLPKADEIKKFMESNLANATVSEVIPDFDRDANILTLRSTAMMKPILLNHFGIADTTISVLSKAEIGTSSVVEFALALDTTLSMNDDGRMTGLKNAANSFVKTLFDQKDRGADVKGAIVPFSNYVNVGVSKRSANWMNVPADIDTRTTSTVCTTSNPVVGTTNCRMETTAGFTKVTPGVAAKCWVADGYTKCDSGTPETSVWVPARTSRVCDNVFGAPVTTCAPRTTGSLTTWTGCVSSRAYPDNIAEAYGTKPFPGVIGVNCAPELLPLTNSRSALTQKINALTPLNDTYITDGVLWGIRVLTHTEPFTEGLESLPTGVLRKALVVMTDGKNTISPRVVNNSRSANRIFHTGNDAALADRYTREACLEAKNLNIEVYTISFGSDVDSSIRALLQDCASKDEMNFHASDSVGLSEAFGKITTSLLAVRLIE